MIAELVHVYMVWGWFGLVAGAVPSIFLYVKGVRNA